MNLFFLSLIAATYLVTVPIADAQMDSLHDELASVDGLEDPISSDDWSEAIGERCYCNAIITFVRPNGVRGTFKTLHVAPLPASGDCSDLNGPQGPDYSFSNCTDDPNSPGLIRQPNNRPERP